MIAISIPGEAVPFARMRTDRRHPDRHFEPQKQSNYKRAVGLLARRAMAGDPPISGPLSVQARFIYSVPASWSAAKAAAARWKTSKPDADNLVKLLKDALNKIVWIDDAQVADLTVQKVYGPRAETIVTVAVAG